MSIDIRYVVTARSWPKGFTGWRVEEEGTSAGEYRQGRSWLFETREEAEKFAAEMRLEARLEKIHIIEFMRQKMELSDDFYRWYLSEFRATPHSYPLKLSAEEWEEEFSIFQRRYA